MWTIDRCEVEGITLEGLATGGEATSIRVPNWGLIFDIGVCLPQCIAHRYHSLLISHGHSDHAAAFIYLLGQRGMKKLDPIDVYLPVELVEPFKRLIEIWQDIEGYERHANFFPVHPGETFTLRSGQQVKALRTVHRVPSLAYLVGAQKPKADAPFEPQLCITGDTKIEFVLGQAEAREAKVMIHEVTAWNEKRSVEQTRERGHTHVQEIIDHAELFAEHKKLVLVHRSPRHSRRFAQSVVDEKFPEQLREKVVIFG